MTWKKAGKFQHAAVNQYQCVSHYTCYVLLRFWLHGLGLHFFFPGRLEEGDAWARHAETHV